MMAIAWALIGAEAIKLRRTAALWLAVLAPVFAIVLELIIVLGQHFPPTTDASAFWRIPLQSGTAMWLGLCVPVFISFEAACLTSLEHSGKQWKQLFAFAIPRWSVFATKMLFCGLLAWVGILAGMLGVAGDVLIYGAMNGLHVAAEIPWVGIFDTAGKACAASCLLIVIQTWISARFAGLASPVGIGLAALIVGGFVLLPLNKGIYSSWYPWTLPFRTLAANPGDLHSTLAPAVFGSVGGIVLGALACWDLGRRRELA